jgi:hypothetical protein
MPSKLKKQLNIGKTPPFTEKKLAEIKEVFQWLKKKL